MSLCFHTGWEKNQGERGRVVDRDRMIRRKTGTKKTATGRWVQPLFTIFLIWVDPGSRAHQQSFLRSHFPGVLGPLLLAISTHVLLVRQITAVLTSGKTLNSMSLFVGVMESPAPVVYPGRDPPSPRLASSQDGVTLQLQLGDHCYYFWKQPQRVRNMFFCMEQTSICMCP